MKQFFLCKSALLYLLLIVLSVVTPTRADTPALLRLGSTSEILPVGEQLQHWQPAATDDTLEQVRNRPLSEWEAIHRGSVNFVYTKAAHWFRLDFINDSNTGRWYLEIPSPHLDEIEVYLYNQQDQLISQYRLGDTLPFVDRPVLHPNFLVPFQLQANERYALYFRIKTTSRFFSIPALIPDAAILPHLLHYSLLYGGFFSVMLILSAYSLVIFLVTRVSAHLAYVVFQISFVLYHAAQSGYGFQYLWPNQIFLQQKMYSLAAFFSFACATIFIINFLQLRKLYPRLYRVSMALTVFWCVWSLCALFLEESVVMTIAFPFQIGSLFFALFGCIWIWWGGYRNAGYFTLGWGAQLIGTVLLILVENGLIQPSFFGLYGMQIGSVIQMVGMSFALAELIRDEKEKKQRAVQTSELLAREVERHTQALETRNHELLATQRQLVQQDKMAVLGIVSAGMAHEINNPNNFVRIAASNIHAAMDSLKGYINSLLTDDVEADIRQGFEERFAKMEKQLEMVDEGTSRISGIVDSMRHYSRNDATDMQPVDIVDALAKTAQLVQMNYKNIARIHCDTSTHCFVKGKPTQLKQVFMNLLVNACQAIEERLEKDSSRTPGRVEITLENNGETLCIKLHDNGCGMPDHVKQRLFERHFTTKGAEKGTGLGLSISREIIQQHGGQLSYESVMGEGTTAIILLPLAS